MAKKTNTIPGAGGTPSPEDAGNDLQHELSEAAKQAQAEKDAKEKEDSDDGESQDGEKQPASEGEPGSTDGQAAPLDPAQPGTDGADGAAANLNADGQGGTPSTAGAGGEIATFFTPADKDLFTSFEIVDNGGSPTHAAICNAAENPFITSICESVVTAARIAAGGPVYVIPTPDVPTPEQVDAAAKDPQFLAICQQIVDRGRELQAEMDKPAPLSIDEMAAANHALLEKTYGKDFLKAKRGTNFQYWSRSTWNSMGKNKQGWEIVVDEMPEVAAAKQAATE